MSEWQPIETAPHDGTEVWVFMPGWRAPKLAKFWDYQSISYGVPGERTRHWALCGGFTVTVVSPTHWLPIPALPKIED